MHDHRTRRGPNPALLLLIPAALMVAKGARRRRAMWAAEGWSGPAGHGFGHHGRFATGQGDPRAFRLPPWIEQALDAWHTTAHASAGATDLRATPPTRATPDDAAPGTATV